MKPMATVRVELFGIPRQRAGRAIVEAQGRLLGDVLSDLAGRFPGLAECCIEQSRLRAGFVASLDGQKFVTDPETELAPGEAVLILSADAGG
jgi:molybdopterin converting factor small subunit